MPTLSSLNQFIRADIVFNSIYTVIISLSIFKKYVTVLDLEKKILEAPSYKVST